jgi:uncharacterized protein YbaP (TraB family)
MSFSRWLTCAATSLLTVFGAAAAIGQSAAPSCPPQMAQPTPEQIQAAASTARDRGALWRLTRDGRASYLFGTIHVGKLDWVMPGPQVREALKVTDTLALEIDPTDAAMAARMARPQGDAPLPTLPAALKTRLARGFDAACLPAQMRPALEAQHPVMQAMTLTALEARWVGLDVGFAQEFALAGFARAAQRRIVSLETPESQFAALVPKDAAELNKAIASLLDQLDKGAGRRTIARLAAAWERGDLDEMAAYERWCECVLDDADRQLMARLLDERNPGLADRIDALHREGTRVFAGVGALHMVGPKALPQLLRERGFQVERIAYR